MGEVREAGRADTIESLKGEYQLVLSWATTRIPEELDSKTSAMLRAMKDTRRTAVCQPPRADESRLIPLKWRDQTVLKTPAYSSV